MKSKTIVLVGCGAKKASFPCSAEAMYQGVLFKKALAYAKQMQPDKIYIISAKYHLLELGDDIEQLKMNEEITTTQQENINELTRKRVLEIIGDEPLEIQKYLKKPLAANKLL